MYIVNVSTPRGEVSLYKSLHKCVFVNRVCVCCAYVRVVCVCTWCVCVRGVHACAHACTYMFVFVVCMYVYVCLYVYVVYICLCMVFDIQCVL